MTSRQAVRGRSRQGFYKIDGVLAIRGYLYGYFAGGTTGIGQSAVTDQITFSTQTTAAKTSANLSSGRIWPGGLSDGVLYGYVAGGSTGSMSIVADALTFSTQATAAKTSANLSLARAGMATASDGSLYGYFAGGGLGGGPTTAVADAITFSTQTTAAKTSANLSLSRESLAGLSEFKC